MEARAIARTSLTEEEIGEYSGERKEIRPVTIATYQVITRRTKGEYRHLELFDSRDWGLIIYDEVHLLPAPVFRMTADLQSRAGSGLTATLIREDGREGDVFSPDRAEALRRAVEGHRGAGLDRAGRLHRGPRHADRQRADALRDRRARRALQAVLDRAHQDRRWSSRSWTRHPGEPTLVIGAYLDQLDELGASWTPRSSRARRKTAEREALYDAFRRGEIQTLVVSKVANFSIDLPEATVAVQVSGTFGSRQEEAQRLGRLLRPKADGGRRTSTRWCPATPSTPSTPRTGSASWPNRATATSSWTPTTCSGQRSDSQTSHMISHTLW